MTDEELDELWASYVATRDPQLQEALVLRYEPLARYLARRALAKAPPHQDHEDILSYAHHGLLNAIERFDPSKGFKFETYATRRISGAIIDGQRKQDPLGRQLRKRVKAMAAAQDDLWTELGRQPTLPEIAERMGVDLETVRELILAQQTLQSSLDDQDGEDASGTRFLAQQGEPELSFQMNELAAGMAERLCRLSLRERIFLVLHYVEHKTLAQVSVVLGVSEQRCGQLRQEVIESLRVG